MRVVTLPWGLGHVTPLNAEETCDWILQPRPDIGRPLILGNLNLHALYLTLESGPVRTLTKSSDVVLIDGWPILQLARLSSQQSERPTPGMRIGSSDWLEALIERDPPLRVIAVGGTPETSRKMAEYAVERTTLMKWHAFDGYAFSSQAIDDHHAKDLQEALEDADLVLVGLGMPKQEEWILANLGRVMNGAIVANVGGCFDYFAGTQRLAPRWMGRAGLEWLYRLAHSPRRLATRYLVEPILLISRVIRLRYRRRELP